MKRNKAHDSAPYHFQNGRVNEVGDNAGEKLSLVPTQPRTERDRQLLAGR